MSTHAERAHHQLAPRDGPLLTTLPTFCRECVLMISQIWLVGLIDHIEADCFSSRPRISKPTIMANRNYGLNSKEESQILDEEPFLGGNDQSKPTIESYHGVVGRWHRLSWRRKALAHLLLVGAYTLIFLLACTAVVQRSKSEATNILPRMSTRTSVETWGSWLMAVRSTCSRCHRNGDSTFQNQDSRQPFHW